MQGAWVQSLVRELDPTCRNSRVRMPQLGLRSRVAELIPALSVFLDQFVISLLIMLLLLSHFSRVRLCVTPQTAAHQAPLSLGFSRQKHWSGLPFPSPMHESEK